MRTIAYWVRASAVLLAVTAGTELRAEELTLGKPIRGSLAEGAVDRYELLLEVGQAAHVTATQDDVDLVLSIAGPGGEKLLDMANLGQARGPEAVTIAAARGGIHRIDVRTAAPSLAGDYAIRLERLLSAEELQAERLATLGRVWGAVKFFHPYLAYRSIDWDAALVAAIPAVVAAQTAEDYRAAIDSMLSALDDPATITRPIRLEEPFVADQRSFAASREPVYFELVDDHLAIYAADWARALAANDAAALARRPEMLAAAPEAAGIVLDLRYEADRPDFLLISDYLTNVLPSLVHGPVPFGTERRRQHDGYAPQLRITSGGYSSGFVTQVPGAVNGAAAAPKPLALVFNRPVLGHGPLFSGLQAYGARLVQVGDGVPTDDGSVEPITAEEGFRVFVRTAEAVLPSGLPGSYEPDVRLPADAPHADAIAAAVDALRGTAVGVAAAAAVAGRLQSDKDDPYPEMTFPSAEYRLLALFRLWNVVHYFFPYRNLMDRPWDDVLPEFAPKFLANESALDYELTIAELVARLQDSHGRANLRNLQQHLGHYAPPARLGASAGGLLTVVGLADAAAAGSAGVRLGDVVLAIDGQSAEERIAELAKYHALSTRQAAYLSVYPLALRGQQNTTAAVRVRGVDGAVRDLQLTRSMMFGQLGPMPARATPVSGVLENGYGYIDLARLQIADAHAALDAVLDAPALIFDMRGYPNGTAWTIAPRLTHDENVTGALFRRPLLFQGGIGGADTFKHYFEQKLPPRAGPVYEGEVVVLIDHHAISQAEHTCLFIEAAADATFIGSPTTGANGDVTDLVLPGAIGVMFTGHDVRHADGRQLQRVGIEPDVFVEPTPRGISEGRDEVLERAVEYLEERLGRASGRRSATR